MNRKQQQILLASITLLAAGIARPGYAANLLTNPGFEYPQNVGSESKPNPTSWVFYGSDIERESFQNNTPGGVYSVWLKDFEVGAQGVYQDFSAGVQPGTSYTFTGYYYFEANFALSDAVVDVELSFLSSTGNDLGADTYTYIAANSTAASSLGITPQYVNPATTTWTPYSVTATAPSQTATVEVSFDYQAAAATSGASISSFVDDGDLEGAGTPPLIPTWSNAGSGDWNNASDWNNNIIPNGVGATAQLYTSIGQNSNVYSDIAITEGTIDFKSPFKYVIDGAGTLTLQATTGNASVIVEQGTQEINLPTTIASNTVLNVASGASLIMADPISINSGLTLTQTGSGTVTYESTITVGSSSSIAFGNSTHAHALTLLSSSGASLSGSGTTVTLDSLQMASGAKLDVGKDQVNVNYVGASPASTIAASLKTGYANGAWNGAGIASSAASYATGTSVGYYDTGTQVEIKYTWIGDLNLDGVINNADFTLMGTAGEGWQHGDLNYDGAVNNDDYSLFAYGAALAGSKNINTVPEPGVAGLIVGAALLRRRRRA